MVGLELMIQTTVILCDTVTQNYIKNYKKGTNLKEIQIKLNNILLLYSLFTEAVAWR